METSISKVIEKYISDIASDEFHRYRSWDNCYQSFRTSSQSEIQVLELAFYLASWGMYRGSSGLLQKNHLIHKATVEIIYQKANQKLKCDEVNEVKKENIQAILSMKRELAKHYKSVYFTKGNGKLKPISPTDTLLSKIMLGTLGCVPAYDRYFIEGLKEMKMAHHSFVEDSLIELFKFIENNKKEVDLAQKFIMKKTNKHYPVMKIIDMYFWQIGYDIEMNIKKT